ncbi:MAG: hypothetical protein MJZ20_11955 [Bacteroidaceae bacterium]|nr:hypothetical protein [Bacteroidaceae bacterium]
MINYSLSYRKKWVTNPDGTRSQKPFAYAKAQDVATLEYNTFAKNATEKSVYGSAVLQAVIIIVAEKIMELVKNSYRVTVGDIGVFGPAISSKGVEDIADYTPQAHINKAYVLWSKSADLANLKDVSYQLVSTNADQAAVNRAVKNADPNVTLPDTPAKKQKREENE